MNIVDQIQPFFSIIIPTLERPTRCLDACLRAIEQLNYPKNCFEVILIDDGSPVPPHHLVKPYRDSLTVSLYTECHIGPANARNLGVKYARGSYIAFTDDDCQPDREWLRIAAQYIESHPDDAIGGKTANALTHNLFSYASDLVIDYLYEFYNRDHDTPHFLNSNNMIVKKDLFQDVGGFTTKLSFGGAGEDREFTDRWLYSGYKAKFIPELFVNHLHKLNLKSFWKQQFNYGRAAFHYRRLKDKRKEKVIKLEGVSFYIHLLFHPFKKENGSRAVILHVLVVLSQIAILSGFLFEKIKSVK